MDKLYIRREWGIQKVEVAGFSPFNISLDGKWTIRDKDGSFINAYPNIEFVKYLYQKHELVIFGE